MDIIELEKTLTEIHKNKIVLFDFRNVWNLLIHNYLFPNNDISVNDLTKRKEVINLDILNKNRELDKIFKKNIKETLIKKEIEQIYLKHDLLFKTYDIEANKLNSEYLIKEDKIDYDFYNKELYWINKKELISDKIEGPKSINPDKYITKNELNRLFKILNTFFPEVIHKYWNYLNFSASKNIIHIPNKKRYELRDLITIFFHEMTHVIRSINHNKNLWFDYSFFDNREISEGLALYNEYLYWNQIINIGDYYPYYDKIYQILLKRNQKEDKIEEIYQLLLNKKHITRRQSVLLIKRHYRFNNMRGKDLLLKETTYYNGYKKVKEMLESWYNMNYLMAIKGWAFSLDLLLNKGQININNIDSSLYFEKMVKEIKTI